MTEKRKPSLSKGQPRGDTRVSLAPLGFEEALRDLMATGKPTDDLSDEEVRLAVNRAIADDQRDGSKDS
jgi:hypothetical protein